MNGYFGLYHETFHIRRNRETFFSHRGIQGSAHSFDKILSGRRKCAYGQCHSLNAEPDSILNRSPRSPLHVVSGADEEASRWRQTVCPLHLPEVRLPAHHQARTKTTEPGALTLSV